MIIREFKWEIFVVGNSYITRAREKRSSTNLDFHVKRDKLGWFGLPTHWVIQPNNYRDFKAHGLHLEMWAFSNGRSDASPFSLPMLP